MIGSAAAWQPSILRLDTITWAPCCASSLAMASPIPRLAPETKAILPSRSNRVVLDMVVPLFLFGPVACHRVRIASERRLPDHLQRLRSEEHTSELQSLMRISYAVFCLKQKKLDPKYCKTSS